MQTLEDFLGEIEMLARDHHDSDDCRTSNLTEFSLVKAAKLIREVQKVIKEFYAYRYPGDPNFKPYKFKIYRIEVEEFEKRINKILNNKVKQ